MLEAPAYGPNLASFDKRGFSASAGGCPTRSARSTQAVPGLDRAGHLVGDARSAPVPADAGGRRAARLRAREIQPRWALDADCAAHVRRVRVAGPGLVPRAVSRRSRL